MTPNQIRAEMDAWAERSIRRQRLLFRLH